MNFTTRHNNLLFPSYVALAEVVHKWEYGQKPWRMLEFPVSLPMAEAAGSWGGSAQAREGDLLQELEAARLYSAVQQERWDEEISEQKSLAEAKSLGLTEDCNCCFESTLQSRLVYCTGAPSHVSQISHTISYKVQNLGANV